MLASIIASLTWVAPTAMAAKPRPGNTKQLLHWPISRSPVAVATGAKGLPVASRARPPLQRSRFSGVTSARGVGLERGSTIGRSTPRQRASTTAWSKAPARVEVPISTPGCTASITASSPGPWPPSPAGRPTAARSAALFTQGATASLRSASPSCTRPKRSIGQMRAAASRCERPACSSRRCRRSAMPQPALPAPKITIRSPARERPRPRRPARIAAAATPLVPWMSSLKLAMRWRKPSSTRRALEAPKSSQCTRAPGHTCSTALMKASRKAS